jgi:excisionase family DNA binding protein
MAGAGGANNGSNGHTGHGEREEETTPCEPKPLLIPAGEVAEMLGISTRTLWRLVGAGRVPAPIRLRGSTRWPREQIRSWVALGCPVAGSGRGEQG